MVSFSCQFEFTFLVVGVNLRLEEWGLLSESKCTDIGAHIGFGTGLSTGAGLDTGILIFWYFPRLVLYWSWSRYQNWYFSGGWC